MGFYNVVRPCYVRGKGHYTSIPSQPIEVDDEVAAPLVNSGSLEPYRPGGEHVRHDHVAVSLSVPSADAMESAVKTYLEDNPVVDPEPNPEKPAPRPRNPRRPKD